MATKRKSSGAKSGAKIGRAKPTMIKAGVTANRNRKYCGGGKLKVK